MPATEDRALVLQLVPYGDHDAVVTLLSHGHGRLACFARGARRTRPRFGDALQPFTLLEAEWRTRRTGSLAALVTADPVRAHRGLRRDLTRLAWAGAGCEAARELCPEGLAVPEILALLLELLHLLDGAAVAPTLWPAFLLQLVTHGGFAPELDRCVACGRAAPPGLPVVVYAERGGVVCRSCRLGMAGGRRLEAPQVQLLRYLRVTPLGELGDPESAAGDDVPRGAREDIEVLALWLERTLELQTGRPLRSLVLLRPEVAPRPAPGAGSGPG